MESVDSRLRVALALSSALLLIAAALLAVPLIFPVVEFSGYMKGYASLLSYNVTYAHDGEPQRLSNLEWISLSAKIYVVVLLIIALASLSSAALALRGSAERSAEVLYGASLALVLAYIFLARVLYGALEADLAIINGLVREKIVMNSLAGEIEVVGVSVKHSGVARWSQGIALLLTLNSALVSLASLIAFNNGIELSRLSLLKRGFALALLLVILFQGYGSVFVHYPEQLTLAPQPPPVVFHSLHSQPCMARTARGALTYTDFETYPVPGWQTLGGVWQLSAGGGYRGNALRGYDNNAGVGSTSSQYYWNTRIDSYNSLWVVLRVRAEGTDGYKGIGLINAAGNALYEISVRSSLTIYRWTGSWALLGSAAVQGYAATSWYTIVLNYADVGTAINFRVWVYDVNGNLVASLTASDSSTSRFRPAYAGVTIDAGSNVWFRFEDFLISTRDPRSVIFENIVTGYSVQVIDNLNNIVGEATATASTVNMSVVRDIVVGTGSNGRIVVRDSRGQLACEHLVPTDDAILGGDTYRLVAFATFGPNMTSAQVSASPPPGTAVRMWLRLSVSQPVHARMIVNSVSAPELSMTARVVGASPSTNIQISNGNVIVGETSFVPLVIGTNNVLEFNVTLSATPPAQRAVDLWLELCTGGAGGGACVRYPLTLRFR